MRYLILFLCVFTACQTPVEPEEPIIPQEEPETTYTATKSLISAAPFRVGVAGNVAGLKEHTETRLIDQEFNSMTAEYEMKQNIMHISKYDYDWVSIDEFANYTRSRGMRVHGHALLWHSAIPSWLENFTGSDEEFSDIMKAYIQGAVSHRPKDVQSWDVVNEAFEDNGDLRNSIFRQKMGDDYIAQCFQWAHEADSSVKLFYNDYGTIWDDRKLTAMLEMLDDFEARGIPIHGVGFQMHITWDWPVIEPIKKAVDAVASRGWLIHFSEVDIRVNEDGGELELNQRLAELQQARMTEIVNLYNTIPEEQQFGITFWGLRDTDSWLIDFWGNVEWPLLFDHSYKHKLMHKGFVEAFE